MRPYLPILLLVISPSSTSAKVYAVLLGDTDATPQTVGKALERDVNAIDFALTAARARYGDDEYEIKRFVGADCTWANIHDYLHEYLPQHVTSDDTVLCYIGCHGSVSDYRNQRFHFSHDEEEGNESGSTFRFSIFDEMKDLEPKLAIFIYDCCSAFSYQDPDKDKKLRSFLERPLANANAELIHAAMTHGEGFIEVASSSEGEFSRCTKRGSIFTMAIAQVLYSSNDSTEKIIASDAPWRKIFEVAASQAHEASPGQRPSAQYMYERPAYTYKVSFKNHTSEQIRVNFKFWTQREFWKDEDGSRTFVVDADDIVVVKDEDDTIPIYALEYEAEGMRSSKSWKGDKYVIRAGVDYNAGADGDQLKWHNITFDD